MSTRFFTRVTEDLKERLTWINNSIEQIERKLAGVAEPGRATVTPQSPFFFVICSTTRTDNLLSDHDDPPSPTRVLRRTRESRRSPRYGAEEVADCLH